MNSGSEKKLSMDELMTLNRPEPSPQPTAQESSSPITPIVIQCPLPEALTMLTQKTESIGWEVRGMREYLPNLRSHTDLTAVQNSMAEIQKSLTEMTTLLEQAGKKKEKHSCKWLDWLPDFDLIVVAKWIVLVLLIVAALLGMMDDMSNGDIAVIITKDLSRLGRNQLHTGLYIEEIFPSNDVRYIAVNDNVDTKYENSNELMPFKNLFNEWHVRDCSRKVRNVVNAKAQRGIRVGTRAPYGYRKGATKDSPLLVDEEAAAVVKRIFAMCAGGMGPAQIAKQLKKECIYSPSMYAYTKFGTSHSGLNAERPYNWTGDMVADMLQNMVYLGHTVNLRYSTKSYKDKKRCERPKSEWLIFENTHEELVDQETWDIVQEVRSHKRRRTNMDEQNMFSGLVYCADCGKPMALHRAHTMKPEQNHFTCRTYKKDGAEVCSAHYIREVALKEIVLETIRRATEFARSAPERFAAYIQQKQSTEVAKEIRGVERELSTMRKRDGELDVVFKRMYEDSALGRVSNEQFRLLSEAYSKEKAQLAEAIPATEERLEKLRSSMANAKNFIAKARKFTDMTELTPELLRTFVAKIIVYEKEVKYSKHAPQKIHICFRDFNLNETDDMLLCGETTEKADSTIALPA